MPTKTQRPVMKWKQAVVAINKATEVYVFVGFFGDNDGTYMQIKKKELLSNISHMLTMGEITQETVIHVEEICGNAYVHPVHHA